MKHFIWHPNSDTVSVLGDGPAPASERVSNGVLSVGSKDGTNGYSRTVRVSDAGSQTEVEKLGPLIESAAKGAAEGAGKTVRP